MTKRNLFENLFLLIRLQHHLSDGCFAFFERGCSAGAEWFVRGRSRLRRPIPAPRARSSQRVAAKTDNALHIQAVGLIRTVSSLSGPGISSALMGCCDLEPIPAAPNRRLAALAGGLVFPF